MIVLDARRQAACLVLDRLLRGEGGALRVRLTLSSETDGNGMIYNVRHVFA